MRLRPTPPVIPPDLLDRYGEPEHVFGPNMRFRIASVVMGTVLLLLAVTFFIFGMADRAAQGPQRSSGGLLVLLSAGLLAVGGAAIVFPMSIPLNWVFVFPKGLVRTRGAEWDNVDWVNVLRFEDMSLSSGVATSEQCRIITLPGLSGDSWPTGLRSMGGWLRFCVGRWRNVRRCKHQSTPEGRDDGIELRPPPGMVTTLGCSGNIDDSVDDVEPSERIGRFSVCNLLRLDVLRHPQADVSQECFDSLRGAIDQQFDPAIGQITHPAADRMKAGDPRRGRPESNPLHMPGVINQLCHRQPSCVATGCTRSVWVC
jgi:hypothetical protein